MLEIYLTQAGTGDCILIRCGEEKKKVNILVDSGQGAKNFEKAVRIIDRNQEKIDLLILTHDDNDHVKGACGLVKQLYGEKKKRQGPGMLLGELTEERILFNFGGNDTEVLLKAEDVQEISEIIRDRIDFHKVGFVLSDEKAEKGVQYPNMIQVQWQCENGIFESEIIRKPGQEAMCTGREHLQMIILSPNRKTLLHYIENAWKGLESDVPLKASGEKKENEWGRPIQYWVENPAELKRDQGLANLASIAFLLEYHGIYAVFAGDASPEDMVAAGREYLKRSGRKEDYLETAFIKLPHHGSSHNISREFLDFFRTKTYLISTCGHSKFQHPGKKTFALIANTLSGGETAEIYSNYSWWQEKEAFCSSERHQGNWDETGNVCELTGPKGEKKYLRFHKLQRELTEICSGIWFSR